MDVSVLAWWLVGGNEIFDLHLSTLVEGGDGVLGFLLDDRGLIFLYVR